MASKILTKTTRGFATGLFAMAMVFTAVAPAASEVTVEQAYTQITGPELQGLMQDWDYRAELDVDNVGDPKITSNSNGVSYAVFFYECDDQTPKQCGSLGLSISFDLETPFDIARINEWNLTKRFASAALDDEGDPKLEMSVNVVGGVTAKGLREWFDWWETGLGEFLQHIDW